MKYNKERHFSMQLGIVDVSNRDIHAHSLERRYSRTASGQAEVSEGQTSDRTGSDPDKYVPVPDFTKRSTVYNVLALITGGRMDTAILPMLLRFLERPSVVVTLFVPSNTKQLEASIREAYMSFKVAVKNNPDVKIVKMECPHDDLQGTFKHVVDTEFDLFVSAFVAPHASASPDANKSADIEEGQSRKRSKSVSEMVAATLVGYEPQPEEVDVRMRVGCPPELAASHLEYPELGYYGSRLYETGHESKYIITVHEPKLLSRLQRRMTQRNLTSSSPNSPPSSSVNTDNTAFVPTSLNAIAEVEMISTSNSQK
jgi:hypothetical protein